MVRIVKGEPSSSNGNVNGVSKRNRGEERSTQEGDGVCKRNRGEERSTQEVDDNDDGNGLERRALRCRYLAVKNLISDKRDDLTRVDSKKFKSIFEEVESLHQLVKKPREQVADAEALLDITNTLMTSVKAQSNEGVTAADFVSSVLRKFGQLGGGGGGGVDEVRNSVQWKDIGVAVCHVFAKGPGCCTMIGPMNSEIKQRKAAVRKRHARPTQKARPEELENVTEEKTETDKNMATMFNILRKNRTVKLEHLVLNRNSFAQTVENVFAMSFLVKDGRAEIKVDEKGCHLVSPRNAPAANAIASKEVAYSHFIFRFDFRDWKLMLDSVTPGDELMPHRNPTDAPASSQRESVSGENETVLPTTPIRKFSRNRGLVLQEQTVVQDSPESGDSGSRAAAIRKGKRKLI